MSVLYIFAHFDDEYAALPLLIERARAGLEQRLIYVADYASAALAERRFSETRRLLERIGVPGEAARHAGRGTGVLDGALHRTLAAAEAAVREAAAGLEIERLVVPAWEGGHPDHDGLAFLAVRLSQALGGAPIDQVSLYNGRGLPGRLFRGASPLPENGPVTRVPMSAVDWARYAAAVRCFPSQWRTWAGLWPAMFATFARWGYGYQQLSPPRVRERPHAGPLLYERMYGIPYTEVRAALDALG
ncbi:PIG-L deacetylase family protein [Phenylobacterium sp.]|jgi:LmbE family N-acetylglucosaminyl deacetylase|uniref:PIG-L deacetylase family protein n=1 Tax=Phenylobacterium sp. TaxID=1871053 RepID=UPI002E3520B2|nr:PIG-L family deacetylase [Phenylobacterium sp.]HEX2558779.1 PIG-L family deacetylase [Phenylobacterium sp.]